MKISTKEEAIFKAQIMSLVKIFSLGGVQESGKNLYVLEIKDKLFILDAGSKYPTANLYGVDMVVPDISYLVENKNKVAGIFLSHPHDDHIGGVFNILKEFKTPIYASKFTLALLSENLKDNDLNPENYEMIEVSSTSQITIAGTLVRFFDVVHSTYDSLGIVFNTDKGNIMYTGNYTFDQNSKIDYALMHSNLSTYTKEGVLALLTESLGSIDDSNRGSIFEFTLRINNIFISNPNSRIFFSIFASDLLRFAQIAQIAISYGRKIAISGKRMQRIVNKAITLGYLDISLDEIVNLRNVDEKKGNNNDLVIFVSGEREEPFFSLQRMAKGFDKFVNLQASDVVGILTPAIGGVEKIMSNTLDLVYRKTSNIHTYKKDLLLLSHANKEEVKQMINLTKPKYIIPVIGEYRHQYAVRNLSKFVGYNDDQVIIPDLGNVLVFEDGTYQGPLEYIPTGEVLIDGKAVGDIGDVVLRDREVLAADGVLIVVACINPKTRKLVGDIQIDTRGFVYFDDSQELLQNISQIALDVTTKHLNANNKYINWVDYRTDVRTELNRFVYKTTRRAPMIIPTLITLDNS